MTSKILQARKLMNQRARQRQAREGLTYGQALRRVRYSVVKLFLGRVDVGQKFSYREIAKCTGVPAIAVRVACSKMIRDRDPAIEVLKPEFSKAQHLAPKQLATRGAR